MIDSDSLYGQASFLSTILVIGSSRSLDVSKPSIRTIPETQAAWRGSLLDPCLISFGTRHRCRDNRLYSSNNARMVGKYNGAYSMVRSQIQTWSRQQLKNGMQRLLSQRLVVHKGSNHRRSTAVFAYALSIRVGLSPHEKSRTFDLCNVQKTLKNLTQFCYRVVRTPK